MSLGLTEFKGKIIKRCQELLKSNLTTDELITIYLSLYKLEKSTLLTFQEQIYEIIQTLASGSLDGLVLCLDQDHKHKRLLCSRAVTIGFAIELLSLILINQGKDHHQKTSNTLHELCISLLQHKLEDTPEPIKSIINSVATPTFLDQKNTLWNMAECCNLTQSQVTETAIKLHVDGWILGTLLNNVIDEKQTSKIASTSKEVLLTSLYLWQSSLHHLQDLEIALPTIQQFSRGLPEKTLFAWIRESQQIRQFREDRAVGHQLLYLSTCKQEKMKFFTRATSIALEAFQMSDDLKDLAQDFPEQSPIAQAKQRVVIVQRLDQLSSAFADLAQFELPYLRSSLFLLHQKAKLDILLTDVIRRFDLQKSNHHRDS